MTAWTKGICSTAGKIYEKWTGTEKQFNRVWLMDFRDPHSNEIEKDLERFS